MNASTISEVPDCFIRPIRHKQWLDSLKRLVQLIKMNTSTRLVIVTGPTGVGKTTLRAALAEEIEAIASPEMEANYGIVPHGGCSIKAPGPTAFSWKDPYLQILRSLKHPFADTRSVAHAPLPKGSMNSNDAILKILSPGAAQRASNDRLFRILQRTIEYRKPKAILLDEAHHLLRLASSQSLVNQLDHLKFLADETHTLHILFGTYELTKMADLSSALIRRREIVHFPRYVYDPGRPEGSLEDFAKIVSAFERELEKWCAVELLEEVPYLYQGCVGCVGVLRDWLFRAYCAALETPKRKFTKATLDETILCAADRFDLLKDAQDGERYFSKRSFVEDDYLLKLGFTPRDINTNGVPNSEGFASATHGKPSPLKPKRTAKAFHRKPHNDPTGAKSLDANPKNNAL